MAIATSIVVALKVISELVALNGAYGVNFPHVVARDPGVLVDVWNRWDAHAYLSIAQHGYPATPSPGQHLGSVPRHMAFAPLYPMFVAAFHTVSRIGLLGSAELVSFILAILAIVGLQRLVAMDSPKSVSDKAAIVLIAFPTSWFLLAPYPESLSLALAIGAFYAARRRRWLLAGLACAGALLTKYYLVIVVVPVAYEWWLSSNSSHVANGRATPFRVVADDRRARRSLLGLVLPPCIAGSSLVAYCWARFGDPLAFVHIQQLWNRHIDWPWTLISRTGSDLLHLRFLDTRSQSIMELFDSITLAILVVAAVIAYRRLRKSYAILAGGAFALFVCQSILYSETREVLTLFPVAIAGGRLLDRREWAERAYLASAIPLGCLLVARFVTNRFAG